MPCIETYQKVDLRTITLGVPPQEVSNVVIGIFIIPSGKILGSDQRQCNSIRRRSGLLQSIQCDHKCGQCRKCSSFNEVFY